MIANLAAGVSAFTCNVYLVEGERTVLVDAGSNFDAVSRIEERTDDLDAVVLTHTHPDHVEALPEIKAAFDVDVWGYDPDAEGVDHGIDDDETVRIGDHEYRALFTPGHANDHLCFYSPSARVLFAGDLVFQNGSFGRTDFEEGDRETLIESVDRLRAIVDDDLAELHPGHGASVTQEPYDHIELAARMARQ